MEIWQKYFNCAVIEDLPFSYIDYWYKRFNRSEINDICNVIVNMFLFECIDEFYDDFNKMWYFHEKPKNIRIFKYLEDCVNMYLQFD